MQEPAARAGSCMITAGVVVALLAGCASGTPAPGGTRSGPAGSASSAGTDLLPAPTTTWSTGGTSSPTSTSTLPPLPATPGPLPKTTTAAPVRLQVPAIGVDTGLENLGLVADGSLAAPSSFPEAGWYAGGVRPGDPGPAIVAGHVDSYRGPAVFYDLGKLRKGDEVVVTRADRSVVRFVVDSTAQVPKARFPTAAVYGPTPTPELRLITCTGVFDRQARSYLDNLVVTAVLAA